MKIQIRAHLVFTRRTKWISLLVTVFVGGGFLSVHMIHWLRWREHADSATNVAIELKLADQISRVGEIPKITATIVNRGNQEVRLIQPRDGSSFGERTPIISWSIDPWFRRGSGCGNVNPDRFEDVFILKPGESLKLSEGITVPPIEQAGRSRLALRYVNDPDHYSVHEHSSGEGDKLMFREIKRSTPVAIVSNTVEVRVVE